MQGTAEDILTHNLKGLASSWISDEDAVSALNEVSCFCLLRIRMRIQWKFDFQLISGIRPEHCLVKDIFGKTPNGVVWHTDRP